MSLPPEQPLAGILQPVFAIRTETDLGVGDTDGVRQMIDWCHRHRLHILQMLPINETSDDNSPYNAISSQAIDPTTIAVTPRHIPDLSPGRFKAIASPDRVARLQSGPVDYPQVKALKRQLLEAAFAQFLRREFNRETERALEFRAFLMDNGEWLSDYALFRVLMEENGHRPTWERWPPEHRTPQRAKTWLLSLPETRRDELMRRQLFFCYMQWIAFSQWRALRAHGETQRVFLMGDLPFGVSRHSADVWANRGLFDLDWSGGAPPERIFKVDFFTEKWGQNWGVAYYRWDELRRRNFDWWRTRIGNLRKAFHLYRIDHVLGFFRIYCFPWTPDRNAEFLPLSEAEAAEKTGGRLPGFKPYPDDTPEHREFNQRQGEEFLRMVLDASGDMTVIAEDLGVVPEYVPPTLEKLGIPGFRIPFLFREPDGRFSPPRTYPRLSVCQPATHDHPPVAAAWEEAWQLIESGANPEAGRRELRAMMDFAGLRQEEPPRAFTPRLHEGFLRAVMHAPSWLVICLLTDVFGQKERFNVPGAAAPTNWTHRQPHTVRQLDEHLELLGKTQLYTRLAREAGRVWEP